MQIDNEFEVAAPTDKVWNYLLDVPRMAGCLPGAELTEVIDDNNFKGKVTTKLGPVSLRFGGTAKIVERNDSAKKIVLDAAGSEEKGKGQANMLLTATLASSGTGTKVKVSQDLQVSGAAAQYGRGMIQDVTGVLMRDFATNIQNDIPRWDRGEARSDSSATPARGVTIGIQAAKMALKRFLRRLFGRYNRPHEA